MDVLNLFKLVLELAERNETANQPALSQYFERVVAHAKALAGSNFNDRHAITPDAIRLALTLAECPDVAEELRNVDRLEQLSAASATSIRQKMDESFAS
jgi:hypothetical protein